MPSNASSNLRTPSLHDLKLRRGIPFLFLPAGAGLLLWIIIAPSLTQRLLAIALTLFCIELARMAWVDLENIATATCQISDTQDPNSSSKNAFYKQQLRQFHAVVVSTIALEITGLYLSLLSLPLGALVIIASQLRFNLLANIQIHPTQTPSVVSCTVQDRKVILVVNVITTGLLCLWPIRSIRLGLAISLLTLVMLYLTVKYIFSEFE